MKAKSRRKIEMGRRALEFSRAHPDANPGYAISVARLEELLGQARDLAHQQVDGMREVRAASARKSALRRAMTRAHLNHLVRIGRVAASAVPGARETFVMPGKVPYAVFRTWSEHLLGEARALQSVLAQHGLAESLLGDFEQALAQFDEADLKAGLGRRTHVTASGELDRVANEIVPVVRGMDGLNRVRFASELHLLAAWESDSSVPAAPRHAAGVVGPVI